MAKLKENQLINYVYNTLPEFYRTTDSSIGLPLKRYIASLVSGGYYEVAMDINRFLEFLDPMKCPDDMFKELYESFGQQFDENIDIKYQRRFLANIGELIKRRGTYSAVTFLVKILTGLQVELEYKRGYNLDKIPDSPYGRWLNINLLSNSISDVVNMDTHMKVVEEFIHTQVPFYITPFIYSEVKQVHFNINVNRAIRMTQTKRYVLKPEL